MEWLNGLAVELYDEGIVKFVRRLDRCLNCNGIYLEKWTHVVSSSDIKIIWTNTVLSFIIKWSSVWKWMMVLRFPWTFANIYQTIRHHILGDCNHRFHTCETLKCRFAIYFSKNWPYGGKSSNKICIHINSIYVWYSVQVADSRSQF
jgi:hypothetical protein